MSLCDLWICGSFEGNHQIESKLWDTHLSLGRRQSTVGLSDNELVLVPEIYMLILIEIYNVLIVNSQNVKNTGQNQYFKEYIVIIIRMRYSKVKFLMIRLRIVGRHIVITIMYTKGMEATNRRLYDGYYTLHPKSHRKDLIKAKITLWSLLY